MPTRTLALALSVVWLGCIGSTSELDAGGSGGGAATGGGTSTATGGGSATGGGDATGGGGNATGGGTATGGGSATGGGAATGGGGGGGALDLDGGYGTPTTHPRILLYGQRLTELQALASDGGVATARFRQTVEAAISGANVYAFSPWNAALWAHVANDASACPWAVQEIDDFVTAEEALIAQNQRATVAGDSYLEVGDHIGNLALVYDWCFPQTSAAQRARWIAYANQAVWNVWNHMNARWGSTTFAWSGWSVNNPVNNYYYSFLRATVLLGLATWQENPEATTWLRQFRELKIEAELVPTFQRDLVGGGSREGTGYGTAMRSLFELYDLWEATTGERLVDRTPHARESALYFIHSVVPTLDRVAPIGDHARDSSGALFDYHRGYALTLAKLYAGTSEAGVLIDFVNRCSVPAVTQQFQRWVDFVYLPTQAAKPLSDLWPTYYGAGTGHVFARSSWAADATWLHFTAGPYSESHAHRDQGQLLLFKREWLAFDANVESHSGINQTEDFHNLVKLSRGGTALRQREGAGPAQLYALYDEDAFLWAAGDLAPAYAAADGVQTLEREVLFVKPNTVVVFDRVAATPAVDADWLLSSPAAPTQAGNTVTFDGAQTDLTVTRIHPATATTTLAVWSTLDADVTGTAHRLAWRAQGPFLTVLSVDGAVTSSTVADAAGQRGVAITLSDGREVTARFNEASRGGTLELRTSGMAPRLVTLTPLVVPPQRFRVP